MPDLTLISLSLLSIYRYFSFSLLFDRSDERTRIQERGERRESVAKVTLGLLERRERVCGTGRKKEEGERKRETGEREIWNLLNAPISVMLKHRLDAIAKNYPHFSSFLPTFIISPHFSFRFSPFLLRTRFFYSSSSSHFSPFLVSPFVSPHIYPRFSSYFSRFASKLASCILISPHTFLPISPFKPPPLNLQIPWFKPSFSFPDLRPL